jgi:hypothetical protein
MSSWGEELFESDAALAVIEELNVEAGLNNLHREASKNAFAAEQARPEDQAEQQKDASRQQQKALHHKQAALKSKRTLLDQQTRALDQQQQSLDQQKYALDQQQQILNRQQHALAADKVALNRALNAFDNPQHYSCLRAFGPSLADATAVRDHLNAGALRRLVCARLEYNGRGGVRVQKRKLRELVYIGACALSHGCHLHAEFLYILRSRFGKVELPPADFDAMACALKGQEKGYKNDGTPYVFESKGLDERSGDLVDARAREREELNALAGKRQNA